MREVHIHYGENSGKNVVYEKGGFVDTFCTHRLGVRGAD